MSRVNKTENNLKLVWQQLDDACGSLDNALDNIARMVGLSEELKRTASIIDFDAIVSLKNQIEELIEQKNQVNYTVERDWYMIKIYLDGECLIVQPAMVNDELRKLGFLDAEEILKDVPAYIKTIKENGLRVKIYVYDEEWSKRTIVFGDFTGFNKYGEKAGRYGVELGSVTGSMMGYSSQLDELTSEIYEFYKDAPKEEEKRELYPHEMI